MRVIDAETGEPFILRRDEELERAVKEHHSHWICAHPQAEIRRIIIAGGGVQYRRQCLRCGEHVSNSISHSQISETPPEADRTLAERWYAEKEKAYNALIQRFVIKQKTKDTAFFQKYNTYLVSEGWQKKRSTVLKRANNVCEGCLDRQATQVHHLTYNNVFNEFLFELVAICDECHARLHPKSVGDARPAAHTEETEIDDDYYFEDPCCACRYQDSRDHRPWCGKFDMFASSAMAVDGPCGPNKAGLEGLK